MVFSSSEPRAGSKGLDVSTGDQLWAVSAPTDGFAVTGSQLRIQHEGAVSSFDFTDSSDDESVTADKGFDESISALPAPKLPSEDDIRNAKLEVPPACADLTMAEGAKQAFADGKTAEGDYGSSIAINDVTTSVATPKPMVAIDFVCYPGGNWVTDSVGVYDQKLNLVTSIEPWSEDSDFQQLADFNRSIVSAIDLTGPYMTATVSNIAVYGDEEYNAAERTGEAELRFAWSKGGSTLKMRCSPPMEKLSGCRRSKQFRSSSMRPRKATMALPVRWPLMRSCETWILSSGMRLRTHR